MIRRHEEEEGLANFRGLWFYPEISYPFAIMFIGVSSES